MRRAFWKALLSLAGLVAIWGASSLAAPPVYQPKPIPTGPEVYTHNDLRRDCLKFNHRTTDEAYKRVEVRNRPWDKAAISFLEKHPAVWGHFSKAASNADLVRDGKKLVEAGCNDPLVRYCYGVALWQVGREKEAEPFLQRAVNGFDGGKYPMARAIPASSHLATLREGLYGKQANVSDLLELTIAWTVESLRDGSFLPYEQRIALDYVQSSADEGAFRENWQQMEDAVNKTPGPDPCVAETIAGMCEVEPAWKSLGNARVQLVTDEGWLGFKAHLKKARPLLVKAWRRRPDLPYAASKMIVVTMGGQGGPGETPRTWFDRAVAAQMDYEPAYWALLRALLPGWGGSHEAMYHFGVECLRTRRYDTQVPLFFYYALCEISRDRGDKSWWRRPEVFGYCQALFAGYEKAAAGHPAVLARYQSLHAAAAWSCGQYGEARRLLELLGKNADPTAFSNYHNANFNYTKAEIHALSGPWGDALQKAVRLVEAGRLPEALSIYEQALKANSSPIARPYLEERVAALRLKIGFAQGKWTAAAPRPGLANWEPSGSWEAEPDGAVTGSSTGKGLWLAGPEDFGSRVELRGEMEFAQSKESDFNCAIGFATGEAGTPEYDLTLISASKDAQQVSISHQLRDDQTVSAPAQVRNRNTFLIQLWGNEVNVYLNGRLIHRQVRVSRPAAAGGGRLILGSRCSFPGAVVRFRGLQIRKLTSRPIPPAVQAKEAARGPARGVSPMITVPPARPGRFGITLAHALSFAAGAVFLLLVVGSVIPRSCAVQSAICTYCGIERRVTTGTVGGATYRREVRFGDTAISRALPASEKAACSHAWYETRQSLSRGSLLRCRKSEDSGRHFPLFWLHDDAFAGDLALVPHPRQVWHTIVMAKEKAPKETDAIVNQWHAQPFPQWWERNAEQLRLLAGVR